MIRQVVSETNRAAGGKVYNRYPIAMRNPSSKLGWFYRPTEMFYNQSVFLNKITAEY